MGNASNIKNKTLVICFSIFLILSLNIIESLEMGIKPLELKLNGFTREKICSNITLNGNSELTIQAKWGEENSQDLTRYTQTSEEKEIKLEKISQTFLNSPNKTVVEICIIAKNSGSYYGALMFKYENSNLGIGNWVTLNVTPANSTITKITGFVGKELDLTKVNGKLLLFFTPTLILIILLVIILNLNKKRLQA
jgi:hypothetical protein